jgi:ATP-binding cassette subfamily F protein uup
MPLSSTDDGTIPIFSRAPELLEAALQDYSGTLLLVSHDRAFLDNVVTQTVAAEGGGVWKEYAGGYSDYLRQRPAPLSRGEASAPRERGVSVSVRSKLSYKETRELESLPSEIQSLEAEQQALLARMHDSDYYRQSADILRADRERHAEIERPLAHKLERWEALEAKA